MNSGFTPEKVDKLADLLLIGLTDEEKEMIFEEFESIDANINKINEIKNPEGLLEEFLNDIKLKGLFPSIIVEYNRVAFIYPVSDVRITFDSNIKSGLYNYDLFDDKSPTYRVIENDKQVLEVKYNEVLPSHIANILSTVPSVREAVSKFAICRSIK